MERRLASQVFPAVVRLAANLLGCRMACAEFFHQLRKPHVRRLPLTEKFYLCIIGMIAGLVVLKAASTNLIADDGLLALLVSVFV